MFFFTSYLEMLTLRLFYRENSEWWEFGLGEGIGERSAN